MPGAEPHARRHHIAARFQSAGAIGDLLERIKSESGIDYFVSTGDGRLAEIYNRGGTSSLPRMIPIVPNIQGFMRDAVEHGLVGAGLQRVRQMGLVSLIGLGVRSVGRATAVALRWDFPTMLLCFIELELASFRKVDPPIVFLQPQMTDLALAMDNPRMIEVFENAVGRLTGARPGYMTSNFSRLVERFNKWGIRVGPIVAPWQSGGANMRPSLEACTQSLSKADGCTLWADRSGMPSLPTEAEMQFYERHRLAGSVRDDDGLLGITDDASPAGLGPRSDRK